MNIMGYLFRIYMSCSAREGLELNLKPKVSLLKIQYQTSVATIQNAIKRILLDYLHVGQAASCS